MLSGTIKILFWFSINYERRRKRVKNVHPLTESAASKIPHRFAAGIPHHPDAIDSDKRNDPSIQ